MSRLQSLLLSSLFIGLTVTPAACAQDDQTEAPAPEARASDPPPPLDSPAPLTELQSEEGIENVEPVDPEGGLENPFRFQGEMTPQRLGELVQRVDPEAEKMGNGYLFKVQERDLRIVYDENADRMRIITPIIPANDLPDGLLLRLLQANFDSALDSRYSIGSGLIWSSFVHRLSSLTDEDFISGIAQTAVAAETFGTSFSSGAFVFGGGDSAEINEDLLRRLQEAIEESEDDRGI